MIPQPRISTLSLILGTLLTALSSCTYDRLGCPEEYIGHYDLDSNYIDFVNIKKRDKVVYVNDAGDELVFQNLNIVVHDINESFQYKCNGAYSDILYSRQHKQSIFKTNSDTYLTYLWNSFNLNLEDGLTLCDVFHTDILNMPDDSSRCSFSFMLNCDSTDTSLDLSYADPFTHYDTVIVNGRLFENAYKLESCKTEILFTPGVGIIKLVFPNGSAWYFDRII